MKQAADFRNPTDLGRGKDNIVKRSTQVEPKLVQAFGLEGTGQLNANPAEGEVTHANPLVRRIREECARTGSLDWETGETALTGHCYVIFLPTGAQKCTHHFSGRQPRSFSRL